LAASILQLRNYVQSQMNVALDVIIVAAPFLRFLPTAAAMYKRLSLSKAAFVHAGERPLGICFHSRAEGA
jgi:hypothetical protein